MGLRECEGQLGDKSMHRNISSEAVATRKGKKTTSPAAFLRELSRRIKQKTESPFGLKTLQQLLNGVEATVSRFRDRWRIFRQLRPSVSHQPDLNHTTPKPEQCVATGGRFDHSLVHL